MDYNLEELKQAIKEANACLQVGEGVSLLYYMDSYCSDQKLVRIMEDVIGTNRGSLAHG